MREHGWMPWDIDHLTLAEITVALQKPEDRKANQTHGEIAAHVRRWQTLTPRQRLEETQRKKGRI